MYESPFIYSETSVCTLLTHCYKLCKKKILMFLLNYESEWGSSGEREIPVLWENEVRYQICFHNTV